MDTEDLNKNVAAVAAKDFLKSEAERKKAYQRLQAVLVKVCQRWLTHKSILGSLLA